MKKNFPSALLACVTAFVFVFGFSACENSEISETTHTHSWETVWSYDEMEHWIECNGCDEVQNKQAHSFDANDECTVCHYIKPNPGTPVHSHKLTHMNEKPATCTEAGNIEYWFCTECQKYFIDEQCQTELEVEDTVIEPAHLYSDWEIVSEPTCEHDGERVSYCVYCRLPKTEVLPKYEHSYVWCQTDLVHWQVCENGCNYESEKDYHDWDTDNKCKVCNHILSYSIGLEYKEITDSDGKTVAYSVARGNCSDSNVVLPAYYNGLPVTTIIRNAFKGDDELESIVITSNITDINVNAFSNCTSLKEVTIGPRVNQIGFSAFAYCSSLDTVNWYAENCNAFGNTFSGCEKLTSFIIGDNVKSFPKILDNCTVLDYTEKDGALYLGNTDNPYVLLFKTTSTDIKSLTIEDGTHLIYDQAFRDCTLLEAINGTENIHYIGSYAFYGCSALTSIVLSDNITEIKPYTFYNCKSLSEITLGSGIKSFGNYCFDKCTALDTVYYTGTLLDWCGIQFTRDGCFETYWDLYLNDSLAEEIEIPEEVTILKEYAFFKCQSLKSVIIPDSVTEILDESFGSCSNLTSVSLGNGVTYIARYAFPKSGVLKYNSYSNAYYLGNETNPYVALIYGDIKATSCVVNNSTKIICDYAFYGNRSLKEVTIGRDVFYIGGYAFDVYGALTKATFVDPEGWTRKDGNTNEIESISSSSLSNISTAAKLLEETVKVIRNPGTVSETTYIYPYYWYKTVL